MRKIRLGVNIDHVATIRNARGGVHPDPVRAALMSLEAGADGITLHLREDRRHIRDDDLKRLQAAISAPVNLEMAATEEMVGIALAARPRAVCLVPERREEVRTEGGLDADGNAEMLSPIVSRLSEAGIRVSLFIDPDERQVRAAASLKASVVKPTRADTRRPQEASAATNLEGWHLPRPRPATWASNAMRGTD